MAWHPYRWPVTVAALLVTAAAGAAPSQMEVLATDTHSRVAKLNRDLDGAVAQLSKTTGELTQRLSQADEQTRHLQGLIEENQARIGEIDRSLAELRSALFAHFNISDVSPGWPSATGAPAPEVSIAPPEPETATPAVREITTPAAPVAPDAPTQPAAPVQAYGDPTVAYNRALMACKDDDFATALQLFQEYVQKYPSGEKIADVHYWIATCLQNLDRDREAIQAFQYMRETYPNSSKVPQAMHNEAVAHASLGEISQAEALLEAVIDQYPLAPAAVPAQRNLNKLRGNE